MLGNLRLSFRDHLLRVGVATSIGDLVRRSVPAQSRQSRGIPLGLRCSGVDEATVVPRGQVLCIEGCLFSEARGAAVTFCCLLNEALAGYDVMRKGGGPPSLPVILKCLK